MTLTLGIDIGTFESKGVLNLRLANAGTGRSYMRRFPAIVGQHSFLPATLCSNATGVPNAELWLGRDAM